MSDSLGCVAASTDMLLARGFQKIEKYMRGTFVKHVPQ